MPRPITLASLDAEMDTILALGVVVERAAAAEDAGDTSAAVTILRTALGNFAQKFKSLSHFQTTADELRKSKE